MIFNLELFLTDIISFSELTLDIVNKSLRISEIFLEKSLNFDYIIKVAL